jgi:hypothetical protein
VYLEANEDLKIKFDLIPDGFIQEACWRNKKAGKGT